MTVEGFEGPLEMLLELVEERRLDILSVRLGDLADDYLARVRALDELPAEEVAAFLTVASRLVLLKARSLLPALAPVGDEDADDGEEELRARLVEYAALRGSASALGARLRAGERAFPREGGTVVPPPRGGDVGVLAAAWSRILALAQREPDEGLVAPGERYSVERRTAEIEALVAERPILTFATLLGERPTLGFAIVTFIALLDLFRRAVIEMEQEELFGEITVLRRRAIEPARESDPGGPLRGGEAGAPD